MKTAKISKDTAKEMIESGIESLKKLAYDTYPELKEKELPDKWEDLGRVGGYYVDTLSEIHLLRPDFTSNGCKNTLPTKELAEAILALCQLLYLREVYRDNESKTDHDWIYHVKCYLDRPIYVKKGLRSIFTFQEEKTALDFHKNFHDLLEKIKPLYE